MDSLNFRYKIAKTTVAITIVGIRSHDFEDGYLKFFSEQTSGDDHFIILETHFLNGGKPRLEELVPRYQLDTITEKWIELSADNWIALFFQKSGRFVLFLDSPATFSEAYATVLSFFFKVVNKGKGYFFHGAGIKIAQHGLLFLAPAETGKTTLSQRAERSGFTVLSDEMVFISKENGRFTVFSTPFGRLSHGPLETPIEGIFLLKQGPTTRFSRLTPAQALAQAWQDSYYGDGMFEYSGRKYLFRSRIVSVEERPRIFNFWFDLFSSVPCYEMQFTRDFDDWDKLLELTAHE